MSKPAEFATSPTSYEQRVRRANTWLHSLESVQTNLPVCNIKEKVDSILGFVAERTQVGTPLASADGEKYAVSIPKLTNGEQADAAFVPLFAADLALSQYFSDIDMPTYREQLHSVFIPPCRIGNLWRGILMYHEFSHAKHHVDNNFRGQENSHWVEEVNVFQDEHELMRHLFKGYSRRVASATKKVREIVNDGQAANLFEVVAAHDFCEILPKPQSRVESGLAIGATMLDIAYSDIDASTSSQAQAIEEKIIWTKKLYTE